MNHEMLIQSGMPKCVKKEQLEEVSVQMLQKKLRIVEENGKKNTRRIENCEEILTIVKSSGVSAVLKSLTAHREDLFHELLMSNQKSEVLIIDLEKKIETLTGENEEFRQNM